MDFKLVLSKLLTSFSENNIRYALIGGFALGIWGVARGTVDIDFLVNREDMEKVDELMHGLGYECRYRTENVTQFVSPLQVFGEVDFLHAFRMHSLGMLERAEERPLFNGAVSVKVLKIEDLIGLKVQAIANNKDRSTVDMADIEALMSVNRTGMDWGLIEEYFGLFGLDELIVELRRKYGYAQ
ncbi:MAG: nucleotidyl transferase AbiEii/AbiGii toxin family protein [Thermodesulfovibrionales bacterium]